MTITSFNRFEKKYILPENVALNLISEFLPHINKDEHSLALPYYTICNIYYDTIDDSIIKTSVSKPSYKEKLRLRCYCDSKDSDIAFIEIKKKLNGFVNKRRSKISVRDAKQLINEKVMPIRKDYHNTQVLNEIYFYVKDKELVPRIVLSYDRKAYVDIDNPNVRITFDKNIKARRKDLSLNRSIEDENVLDENFLIMEIKTNASIPMWLTDILTKNHIFSSSFSKYGTEYFEYLIENRKEDELCLNPYLISPVLQSH
jgi:hypothetical protein